MKKLLSLAAWFVTLAPCVIFAADFEPLHADALLSFHEGNYKDSLQILERALTLAPHEPKLLELKALNLKTLGDWKGSYGIYQSLLGDVGKDNARRASYEFEMGVIQFRQKNYELAEPHILYALRERFNADASRYLLGSIYFEKHSFRKAQSYFRQSTDSPIREFVAQSHMYLGQISADQREYTQALGHLVAAREIASELASASDANQSAIGQRILQSTQSLVAELEKTTVSGQIGLVTAYDSNVLLNPSSNADAASQNASAKETLFVALAYQTSAVKTTQWQFQYQGAANYNFNQSTSAGQFSINDISASLTLDGQEPTSYGGKLGAQYILRSDSGGGLSFSGYSAVGTVGLFLRRSVEKGKSWGIELNVQPQYFLQDSSSSDEFRKTGWGGVLRLYRQTTSWGFLKSPAFGLFGDLRQTEGTEFRSKAVGVDMSAQYALGKSVSVSPNAVASYTVYQFRSGGFRGDWFLNAQLNLLWSLSSHVNLALNGQVGKNFSNVVDTYEYFRYSGGLGAYFIF